ncbi:hypothetical protein ABVK25_009115 [Lepraria finkii]|uniref:Major facilitator superfamily (MFS) profile domain-containing protein n=1 Tax=Lepraria finkii TaxID=1340010 RepID=A0ABR4AY67_9LECA
MEMNYDENTLHQLEEELRVQIVPGTEIMADVGTHHFVKSSGHSHRVLVPQPSDDPNDPLNWTGFWKFSTLTCATAATFVQGMGPLALAPMLPQLIEAFDSNLDAVIQFTGVAILVLGFSNFIWVPLSTSFGRRPVYLASLLICFGSAIWRAKATTYGSFMGACVLNGIGAGPAETIQPNVIADVMFLHERGAYQTLYFVFYFGSLMIGPIIAGPMAEYAGSNNTGWRNFWWLNVGLIGAAFVMCLFGFPETKWHRMHPDEIRRLESEAAMKSSDEKIAVQTTEGSGIEKSNSTGLPNLSHATTTQKDPWLGKGRPSKQQFKLFQANAHPFQSILLDLWIPWKLFAFPIVEFASFVVSWSASCFLTDNLLQSQAFAAPPYLFSPLKIGFFNFAVLVGAVIGSVTAGPLSDWISMKLTKRNNGIREPEMRLPTMIPYFILMLIGNFVTAFGW